MTDLDEAPKTMAQPEAIADGPWRSALLRFNLHPALYAHASWLPGWAHAAVQGPQLQAALSRSLLQAQGVHELFDWELRDTGARLFLLDPAALRALALSLGVAAHRDRLCRIVWQPQLLALQAALGDTFDALWLPVSEQVQVFPVQALDGLLLLQSPAAVAALRQRLEHDGLLLLLRLVDPGLSAQRAAAVRAAFRLPRALAGKALPPLPGARAEALARAIAEQLLARCAPGCGWLLES